MPEAEIIPLGTGGRPGRGTGRAKPSSAARNLAGKPAPAPKRSRAASPAAGSDPSKDPSNDPSRAAGAGTQAHAGAAGRSEPRSPFTTEEREPTGGIPVGEWLGAIEAGAREVFGDHWERRLAELLAFVRKRLDGDYPVDDFGFDPQLTEHLLLAVLRPIAEKWFRIEVRGVENIPTDGGALVVSNHSGTIPVDGLMTMFSVHEQTGRFLRPLGADLVFRLPLVASIARRAGATLACQADAERMLTSGELVGVWPEGFKGIGKPFSERYKLQRFGRGGFVSAALRTGVPIVPLSVVGAEEIYPIVGNLSTLARLLNLPYLPVTPFFPLLGPLGLVPLPSKWLMEFGEPIRTDAYDEAEAEDPMLVFDLTDQVRETIQQTLFSLLRDRGSAFPR
ncbi:lysophospholipid acyltransferase family protein [Nocardioides solisilvae]|uniref:lysophospholipid acyltransferase family protein n=1 Tax=Nocardioides solisilvae TaxID=1542435 RepID=UPI000D74C9D1|nr:lysophospholipid acyltransferase family protein [Nocardioides solisilvae]